MKKWAPKTKPMGFTIVELLIVIVVIAVLAAITIVGFSGIQQRANVSALMSFIQQTSKKLETESLGNTAEAYPASLAAINVGTSGVDSSYYGLRDNNTGYCLEATKGGELYFATSDHKQATSGSCQNLVGWWPFNNSSNDESGEGIVITSDSAVSGAGQNSSSMGYNFNGSQLVIVDSIDQINQVQGSLSFWIKRPPSETDGVVLIAGKAGANGNSGISALWVDIYGGVLRAGWWDEPGADTDRANIDGALTPDIWHHMVLVWRTDLNNVRLYQDGKFQSTQDVFTQNNKNGWVPQMAIGGTLSTPSFTGSLDDIRFFNVPLNDTQIQQLYSGGAV